KKFKLIFFILILLLFWVKGLNFLDPDFGWHLRTGQIILEKGIPKTDPFSYTMPDYHFVDHEWFSDVLIAKLYPAIGIFGLTGLFALIGSLSIFFVGFSPGKKWLIAPLLLVSISLLPFVGIRPQLITWLFFAVILQFVLSSNLWKKYKFFLPFMFLLWANLHGGFVTGLAVLFIGVFLRLVRGIEGIRKIRGEIAVLFFCAGATLFNPYGFNLWREIWISMSDGSLRWSIGEWFPAIFILNFTLWFFFSFSMVMVIKFRKKIKALELILFFALLIPGLLSIRNMPFWLLFALPLIYRTLELFSGEVKDIKGAALRLNKAYFIFLSIVGIIVLFQVYFSYFSNNLNNDFYPEKAVGFLKINKPKGQIFSEYGWGGYLIWEMPSEKVFIDGRMPSWRKDNYYVFGEYRDLISGKKKLETVIEKYKIGTVLLPIPKKNVEKSKFLKTVENLEEKIFQREKRGEDIYTQLKKMGWKEVYKDKTSVIFQIPG
ncbi:MAG: hypothetical protein M1450_05200, partial [Patescibacteria group bacterium]|nr:hypothetical protein [Patescibacteria group bacterium]